MFVFFAVLITLIVFNDNIFVFVGSTYMITGSSKYKYIMCFRVDSVAVAVKAIISMDSSKTPACIGLGTRLNININIII